MQKQEFLVWVATIVNFPLEAPGRCTHFTRFSFSAFCPSSLLVAVQDFPDGHHSGPVTDILPPGHVYP